LGVGETLAAAVDIPATAADTPATAAQTATAVHTAPPRIITEERGRKNLFPFLLTFWLFIPLFLLQISYQLFSPLFPFLLVINFLLPSLLPPDYFFPLSLSHFLFLLSFPFFSAFLSIPIYIDKEENQIFLIFKGSG
jgi:hypothetical protein